MIEPILRTLEQSFARLPEGGICRVCKLLEEDYDDLCLSCPLLSVHLERGNHVELDAQLSNNGLRTFLSGYTIRI